MLEALTPPERKGQEAPAHPNAGKSRRMRQRGEEQDRELLWRMSGVDLTRIEGIKVGVARTVLTEVGTSLDRFPDEGAFVSWLRLSPRWSASGGKTKKERRNGMGANRLSAALRMAAVSLRNSKRALGAEYRRIARRKCGATAVFALARKLAILVYRALRWGQEYVDEGMEAYERRYEERRLAGLKSAAAAMGYVLKHEQNST